MPSGSQSLRFTRRCRSTGIPCPVLSTASWCRCGGKRRVRYRSPPCESASRITTGAGESRR